ncbi:MAG TPA: molybdate ABC transporter substrate-binding protein [Spirochaetia bacterium]|nr:molybdate ABC transporter substrate-binding protein [Spirochaetia bacterium]
MKAALAAIQLILVGAIAWGGGVSEAAAGSTQLAGEVVVYTAASLTEAFTSIGNLFMKLHPRTEITFNFAGSQKLAQQLALGAPADVFASADVKQMQAAQRSGRIADDGPRIFAHNRLVAVVNIDPTHTVSRLVDLSHSGLKIVLAADTVPVGSYTREFLAKAARDPAYGTAFRDGVVANTVSLEENVRAVLNKVALGDGDAGIVYSSDIDSVSAAKVREIDIPDALNSIADYPIAPITDSKNPKSAAAFVKLVLSPAGQKILAAYGFIPAVQKAQ